MLVMDELYRREFPKIKYYILKNSGSLEDAQDVFQESVIALFRYVKLGKFDETKSIGGFLYVVGSNAWKKANRSPMKTEELHIDVMPDGEKNNIEETLFSEETSNMIQHLFNQIGENCKKLMLISIYDNKTHKEIADEMGYTSTDAVKTRYYKCKQKIIKILEAKPDYAKVLKDALRNAG